MCLEKKELSNKEADSRRKEVNTNLNIVTELLDDIMKAIGNVHILKDRRAHKR